MGDARFGLEAIYKELRKVLVEREGLEGLGLRLSQILGRPVVTESVESGRRRYTLQTLQMVDVKPVFSRIIAQRSQCIDDRVVLYDDRMLLNQTYICAL